VYRRDQQAMGASEHEQKLAQTNGVRFVCNAQPKQILGDENGIDVMEFNRTLTNEQGKLVATDEVISIPCDVVFRAIGQKLHPSFLQQDTQRPDLCKSGRLAVDSTFQTSIPRVYAGGDCIKGKDLVVEAVDHGNKAALAIHQLLQHEGRH
jgi:dihydropyrimidine dehydrogenase (NAD+) subunit PreT